MSVTNYLIFISLISSLYQFCARCKYLGAVFGAPYMLTGKWRARFTRGCRFLMGVHGTRSNTFIFLFSNIHYCYFLLNNRDLLIPGQSVDGRRANRDWARFEARSKYLVRALALPLVSSPDSVAPFASLSRSLYYFNIHK